MFSTRETHGTTDADHWRHLPVLADLPGSSPPTSNPPTTSSSGKLIFSLDWLCCLDAPKNKRTKIFKCHVPPLVTMSQTEHF